ncbi:MAG: hypothetical protein MJZ64_07205 [Paludibacteraceae bacterium]|nr:hypothetical protein [Paludibacteraceae bacterium]
MAKIKPMALVESMSGKVCMHSDVYFRVNKRNGQISTGKMCNPFEGEPTAAQTAVRTAFSAAVTSAKAILAAKSTDTDQSNYDKLQAYTAAYKADYKFGGSLYSYIVKKEFVKPDED